MGSLKNPIFRWERVTKNQYRGEKKATWTVYTFKGGRAWQERGVGDFKGGGGDTPMLTMKVK